MFCLLFLFYITHHNYHHLPTGTTVIHMTPAEYRKEHEITVSNADADKFPLFQVRYLSLNMYCYITQCVGFNGRGSKKVDFLKNFYQFFHILASLHHLPSVCLYVNMSRPFQTCYVWDNLPRSTIWNSLLTYNFLTEAQAWPIALAGSDLLGIAKTGMSMVYLLLCSACCEIYNTNSMLFHCIQEVGKPLGVP